MSQGAIELDATKDPRGLVFETLVPHPDAPNWRPLFCENVPVIGAIVDTRVQEQGRETLYVVETPITQDIITAAVKSLHERDPQYARDFPGLTSLGGEAVALSPIAQQVTFTVIWQLFKPKLNGSPWYFEFSTYMRVLEAEASYSPLIRMTLPDYDPNWLAEFEGPPYPGTPRFERGEVVT